MKIGIVIGTNELEVVWNAFRFGITSLKANHEVSVFLMNKGVEVEEIDDEKYNVKEQTGLFMQNKGQILACGICLKSMHKAQAMSVPYQQCRTCSKWLRNQRNFDLWLKKLHYYEIYGDHKWS